jgi:hypothetical protein
LINSERILLSRQQQPQPRGDDRERITRARQAAEALFSLKPPVSEPSAPESAKSGDHQPARKPRVLRIIAQPPPVRLEEVVAPVSHIPVSRKKQAKPQIPVSQFARIRTWTKYGMTVSEVAEVYGVAPGEIERVLRQA